MTIRVLSARRGRDDASGSAQFGVPGVRVTGVEDRPYSSRTVGSHVRKMHEPSPRRAHALGRTKEQQLARGDIVARRLFTN